MLISYESLLITITNILFMRNDLAYTVKEVQPFNKSGSELLTISPLKIIF